MPNSPLDKEQEYGGILVARFDGRRWLLERNYPEAVLNVPVVDNPLPGTQAWLGLAAGDVGIIIRGIGFVPLFECKDNTYVRAGVPTVNFVWEVRGYYTRLGHKEDAWQIDKGIQSGLMVCRARVLVQRIFAAEWIVETPVVKHVIEWGWANGAHPVRCNKWDNNPSLGFMFSLDDAIRFKATGKLSFATNYKRYNEDTKNQYLEYVAPEWLMPMVTRMVIDLTPGGFVRIGEVEKRYGHKWDE